MPAVIRRPGSGTRLCRLCIQHKAKFLKAKVTADECLLRFHLGHVHVCINYSLDGSGFCLRGGCADPLGRHVREDGEGLGGQPRDDMAVTDR